jgi:hypothetical protein
VDWAKEGMNALRKQSDQRLLRQMLRLDHYRVRAGEGGQPSRVPRGTVRKKPHSQQGTLFDAGTRYHVSRGIRSVSWSWKNS